jgi:anti-sigma regulatory factor (Ser/Thr protein kinase)
MNYAVSARMTHDFEPNVDQVVAARRFAADIMLGWGIDPDDVALVVGELAANAVTHARSPFTVSLSRDEPQTVVIEVADGHPYLPSVSDCGIWSTTGRGLRIVQHMTAAWGVRPDSSGGKVIWAKLDDLHEGARK